MDPHESWLPQTRTHFSHYIKKLTHSNEKQKKWQPNLYRGPLRTPPAPLWKSHKILPQIFKKNNL